MIKVTRKVEMELSALKGGGGAQTLVRMKRKTLTSDSVHVVGHEASAAVPG